MSFVAPVFRKEGDHVRRSPLLGRPSNGGSLHHEPMGRSSRRGRSALARLVACALFVLVLLVRPCDAGAAPSPPPVGVNLTYEAAAGCPARAELLEQLGHRIDPQWSAGLDRRRFVVRIERLPDGAYSGRLEVTRDGRETRTETRELRAETCRAVSAALVVFIAIALDPASDVEPEPETPAPAAPVTPVTPPGEPAPLMPTRPRPPAPTPVREPREPRRAPKWAWTSGGALVYLHAPHDAWGARVDAQLARTIEGHRIAPALRLSWGFADFETRPPNGGAASFRFVTARASGCALVDLAPAPVTVAPCVGLDHGSLIAKSRNVPLVGYTSTAWSAISGAVRASWWVLPWLSIDGEAGILAPFTRTTFALTEPLRVVYRAPSVLFSSSLGLAVTARFP